MIPLSVLGAVLYEYGNYTVDGAFNAVISNRLVTGKDTYSFQMSSLFGMSEQGVWYDPSDFSTLFQDSAGTTPVTAVEQPVGKILDKSGRGNHATQATSASRPVVSARVNLLTKTEDFSDAAWGKVNATVTANAITAPDGTLTADKLVETVGTGGHQTQILTIAVPTASTVSFSINAKQAERTIILLQGYTGATFVGAYFNLATGVVGTKNGVVQTNISASADGFYLCSITFAASAGAVNVYANLSPADGTVSYEGDITKGIYIWGASLVTAAQASLPYQRSITQLPNPSKHSHLVRRCEVNRSSG